MFEGGGQLGPKWSNMEEVVYIFWLKKKYLHKTIKGCNSIMQDPDLVLKLAHIYYIFGQSCVLYGWIRFYASNREATRKITVFFRAQWSQIFFQIFFQSFKKQSVFLVAEPLPPPLSPSQLVKKYRYCFLRLPLVRILSGKRIRYNPSGDYCPDLLIEITSQSFYGALEFTIRVYPFLQFRPN